MNVFIATFSGLGNALSTLPLLRGISVAAPHATIFLPQPQGDFAKSAYRVFDGNLRVSFYPALWRRFAPQNWGEIQSFLEHKNVSTILNWRNEGPTFDRFYFDFRRNYSGSDAIRFFDSWDPDTGEFQRL